MAYPVLHIWVGSEFLASVTHRLSKVNLSDLTTFITGIDRIRVYIFPKHLATASCLVRNILASSYLACSHGFCGFMVPSEKPLTAAGAAGNFASLGT